MGWFFKKKVEPTEHKHILGGPDKCWLHLEIEHDNSLSIAVNWPEPKNRDEAVDLGKLYASFLFVLSSRDILPGIMKSVVLHGEQTNTQAVSNVIAMMLHKAVTDITQSGGIIKPTEVFTRKMKEQEQ